MSRQDDDSGIGLLGLLTVAGLLGFLHHEGNKITEETEMRKEERRKRTNTPCKFDDGISEVEFAESVYKIVKKIKRVKRLSVSGPFIFGVVESQSGISSWTFSVDFNDYGHITGRYWVRSDNVDSNIPYRIGELVSEKIMQLLNSNFPCTSDEESEDYIYAADETDFAETSEKPQRRKKKRLIMLSILLCLMVFAVYEYWQYSKLTPVGITSTSLQNKNYSDIYDALLEAGFTNIQLHEQPDLSYDQFAKEGWVVSVTINGDSTYASDSKYPYDATIIITYHTLALISVPITSEEAEGMLYSDIYDALLDAGFVNVILEPIPDVVLGWFVKDGEVDSIFIDGENKYSKDTKLRPDIEIIIKYHTAKAE